MSTVCCGMRMLSKSITFVDFRISQGSVATYYRWGGNLCCGKTENFLSSQLVKKFQNRYIIICQNYWQTSVAYFFWDTCTCIKLTRLHSCCGWHDQSRIQFNPVGRWPVMYYRDVREWLSTFPFPPIPIYSIPIPSHPHSQVFDLFPFPWDSRVGYSHSLPFPFCQC